MQEHAYVHVKALVAEILQTSVPHLGQHPVQLLCGDIAIAVGVDPFEGGH